MRVFLIAGGLAAVAFMFWVDAALKPEVVEPDCGNVSGCKSKFRIQSPTPRELGAAALAADYIVEESDVDCVGRVIYESDLETKTLRLIIRGGLSDDSELILPVSEGSGLQFAFDGIERVMLSRCGVHAWPKVDRWPDDPSKMY